jgi:cytosine/adenosine deaminase-related metal-dependent hydrolase
MTSLLIRNATCVATFDDARTEWRDASVFVRENRIEAIGPAADLPQSADEVIDARGHLVVPGLVNTHHHMYQSLTRAIPAVQDAELFSWLRGLYPIWAGLTPEMVHACRRNSRWPSCCCRAAPPAATTSTSTPTACGWTTASTRRARSACASSRRAAA